MSLPTTPRPGPCAHTAALADAAVADLAAVIEELGELIGTRCNEHANSLNCMRALLARTAAMVDTVAKAHGGEGWDSSTMHWLFRGELRESMDALNPVALAAKKARFERAQAKRGAA